MVDFWFVRHGESSGNAGLRVESDEQNPLTLKGKQQARYTANYFDFVPDLFVISPYHRTLQTAQPTLDKYPDVPVKTWPIHEYTYLTPEMYAGTTSRQRRRPSVKYFYAADPDLSLGVGAESYNQFMGRINACYENIRSSTANSIVLFGHGWFMRASLWVLYKSKKTQIEKQKFLQQIMAVLPHSKLLLKATNLLDKKFKREMFHFLLFSTAVQTPNAGILQYKYDPDSNEIRVIDFHLKHLPEALRKTTLSNR